MKLSKKYFQQEDVVFLAKDLIGKLVVTEINSIRTGGIITETEAYSEIEKGCHAYNKRKTERTKIMFEAGGLAYVYLCYGMHHLFNIVTGSKDIAQAVLIRSINPTIGVDEILRRRKKIRMDKNLCIGPGKVCLALGITKSHYGMELTGNNIWMEQSLHPVSEQQITATPRIGIEYAEEDKLLPWRFLLTV